MSDLNLLRYYARLTPMGVGEEIKTALVDVSESLFTSLRHARNLLNQMHDLGWLKWEPQSGRNKRSSLILNIELESLKRQLAAQRVVAGKFEKALEILDNDKTEFGRLLQSTSGASMHEGQLHIQLTYKRSFERLVPHQLQRSSERYLLRQIYCCLVSSDRDGRIEPQLAHHWECNDDHREWTFYLRPGLTFHDGTSIDAAAIVNLFTQLSILPEYQTELSHLSKVSSEQPLKVTFTLTEPDQGFAGLISGVRYSIQPVGQLSLHSELAVVGSGPFEIIEHSHEKLHLQAFERYYACRALTDTVTIWRLGELNESNRIETNQLATLSDKECHHYVAYSVDDGERGDNDNEHGVRHSQIEDGCMFVLFNQSTQTRLTALQRRYLASVLSSENVYDEMKALNSTFGCEVAGNILPMWKSVLRPFCTETALPKALSIAVYDYSGLKNCAYSIQSLLNNMGVDVVVNTYSYRELSQKSLNGELLEEIVLTNINLDDNRHASAFGCLFNNPVLHNAIGPVASTWLTRSLSALRSESELTAYLDDLDPIASTLISEYFLMPLFHHRQTLRFEGVLKDVALTNWGWPDIRNVWSAS
ncbi:SgrR family transcriptional regulator [Vibrio sp. 10N.261.55.A7]|uniref:SgrR family transcriptional regulator n=1 Tax=Vibrio sp. 10N.261.55.A7 TaxID=1880851 RepID=UPI000C83FA40|nr:SgrR family transcriptional regulator [Vibrio sp. 10N.261.55.A7]PMK02453.1 transporter [Vibrio sp. 10N.261.55.A7]